MASCRNCTAFPNAADLVGHLTRATQTYYGSAGEAFIESLVSERVIDPIDLQKQVAGLRDKFVRDNVPSGTDGQVRSVAARFGIIAAAGELAEAIWHAAVGAGHATRACKRCF